MSTPGIVIRMIQFSGAPGAKTQPQMMGEAVLPAAAASQARDSGDGDLAGVRDPMLGGRC